MDDDKLKARLEQLQEEFDAGQTMLREAEARQRQLTETLLRISGAMQVLRELLGEDAAETNGGPVPAADARVTAGAMP